MRGAYRLLGLEVFLSGDRFEKVFRAGVKVGWEWWERRRRAVERGRHGKRCGSVAGMNVSREGTEIYLQRPRFRFIVFLLFFPSFPQGSSSSVSPLASTDVKSWKGGGMWYIATGDECLSLLCSFFTFLGYAGCG